MVRKEGPICPSFSPQRGPMSDPRLNSLHLEPIRRQDYRRARQRLLEARGCHTLLAENRREDEPVEIGHTLINKQLAAPKGLDCWLADRDFVYPLKTGLNTVGRSSDNDVVLDDPYSSRRHCALLVHAGGSCEVHDTASKNGTYVNGVRIATPVRLKPGDQVRISNQTFTFLTRDGAVEGASPQATLSA